MAQNHILMIVREKASHMLNYYSGVQEEITYQANLLQARNEILHINHLQQISAHIILRYSNIKQQNLYI